MQSTGVTGSGANRWLVLFTLLFCAATAVPIFVVSPAEGAEDSHAGEAPAPSAAEFVELESQELGFAEWLSSPEAASQRAASRNAYAELSAGEARNLILEAFPGQFNALNADPARVLSEFEFEKPLGTFAALVSDPQGERLIVESSVPVESELGGDGKQPVDLTLEQSGEDFVPANPLVEVELPGSAEEPVRLESGITVELPGSTDHSAQTLGDKNLFYSETETATDTLISPISGGVEVFEQLRSPQSPEEFSFALNLPVGATLVESEAGGAKVLSASGDLIVGVPSPSAVDAQGASVPVGMSVEGDSLLLEAPHRSHEFAYPILVDPEFLEEGYVSFNQWSPAWNDAYILSNASSLSAQAKGGGYTYGANTYGHWVYTTYGQTTYIAAATFVSNTFNLPSNCATEQPTNQPHGYAGLYNPSSGGYVGLGKWSGGSSFSPAYQTGWVGGPGVRQAVVGIGTGTSSVHHKCAFTFSVGGVTIQEKDPEAPTINSVSGTSSKWVKDITITANASDPGLGVKGITLSPGGASPHTVNINNCSGIYTSRCPASGQTSFGVGYFAEGERSASISAYDPLGSPPESDPNHVSSSFTFTTRIDRDIPEVELEGQLAEAIEEAEGEGEVSEEEVPQLSLPVYNLRIDAEDGSNAEGKTKRSGVKDIAVFVDGKEVEVPWGPQECPNSSCSMTKTYPVPLNNLEGDPVHKLKVIAEDQLGNQREREIEFEYVPATGMKDEYVMQYFPLPDGLGNESEEEHPSRPELAVNVMNGNLVYRQKDVDVEGPAVDLEVERFYNSQLPEEDDTEWGGGWTLAQTPELEPEETKEEAAPTRASMVRTSGILESAVALPTKTGDTQFAKELQAVVTKESGGGYKVKDESGETDTSLVFGDAGKVTELQTSGYAKIDYSYEGGDLSEMAVDDPASAYLTPEQLEELRNEPGQWTTQSTLSPEARTEVQLTDVSCASSTSCMAVGYDHYAEKGFAERWDGSEWKAPWSLGPGTDPALSCWAPDSCHILATSFGTQGTWLVKPSSSSFRAFAVPEGATSWKLRDVSCTSESACTAVGYSHNTTTGYKTLVERYNGTSWSIHKSVEPSQGNGYEAMSSVSCASATYCMAVGEAAYSPFAAKWNGTEWTLAPIPGSPGGGLEDVSCTSATSCMAVGHLGWWDWMGSGTESDTLVESWNGSTWSEVETPEPSEEFTNVGANLSAVSCLSASSCVAVGSFFTEEGEEWWGEEKTMAEVWNGSEWTVQSSANPTVSSTLAGVSCAAANQCTAVGSARSAYYTMNNMVTLGERWDGEEWTTQSTLSPEARTEVQLTDVSCPSATDCMAVGYDHYTEEAFAEAWSGSKWKVLDWSIGVDAEPALSCFISTSCHIIATSGETKGTRLLGRVGESESWWSSFRAFAVPAGATDWKLRDVSCSSESACTAVGYSYSSATGYKTLVERYNGTSWSIQKSVEPNEGNGYEAMSSVSCASATHCMAVGEADSKPFAAKWNGSEWLLAPVPGSAMGRLEDVSCPSATSCMAVGNLGWWAPWSWGWGPSMMESETLAASWNGSAWSTLETPEASEEPPASDSHLTAVSCLSASSCVAVGSFLTEEGEEGEEEKALAEVWDGSEWTVQPSTSPAVFSTLDSVSCTATTQCTAIGNARPEYGETNNMVTLGERIKLVLPVPSTDDDPKVEVETSSSLVDSVEGEEAGQTTYEHEDELLTAVDGPDGETEYEYDSEERLTKVTLPNGTWGQVTYDEVDGRVKSVTVDPAGEEPAKTTYFAYQDSPSRRTTVSPEGDPATVYDIGPDGSVLKWWNTPTPPEIEILSGSLYQNKETAEAIAPGDYELSIKAHSAEGIASIEVIANGSTLVDEKTCEQEWETPERECQTLENPWVTNTGNWPPGILNLEVIVTDANDDVESVKFWVNIPYTPPPDPEADEPPTFEEVLHFREEFGLDLDLKGDEQAINERIFDLIGAWNNPNTLGGEIARATAERWGVPLRTVDAAELEYRDYYISHDTSVIANWGAGIGSASYAGNYVNHRAGGIIYVSLIGSKGSQEGLLASISGALSAPSRVKVDPGSPVWTEAQLGATRAAAVDDAVNNPSLAGNIAGVWIDVPTNKVVVTAANLAQAENVLGPKYGSALKVIQGAAPVPQPAKYSRYNSEGPVQAGDYISSSQNGCSAGFGAWDTVDGKVKSNGQPVFVPLQLTAGHCFSKGVKVKRGYPKEAELGKVTRNNYVENPAQVPLDAATIKSSWPDIARSIFINKTQEKQVTGYETPILGQWVCVSGVTTDKRVCGPVLDEPKESFSSSQNGVSTLRAVEIPIGARVSQGDSGGPAWVMGTGQAAGLITGAEGGTYGYPKCTDLHGGHYDSEIDANYICPVVRITTVQQIVTGAATLYNAAQLASEGVPLAEPLYIGGVTVGQ